MSHDRKTAMRYHTSSKSFSPMTETPRNRPSHTREEPRFGNIDDAQPVVSQRAVMRADVRTTRFAMTTSTRRGGGFWVWLLIGIAAVAALGYFNQDKLRRLLPNTELNDLIARGNQALTHNKLSGTHGDSARELFQSVRVLEPDNEQARAGLDQVGLHMLAQAREALQNQDYTAAHIMLDGAQELLAGGAELEKFQADLHAAESRGSQTEAVLQKADAALAAGKLLGAGGAASLYQQVANADAGNALAQNGLKKVAAALANQTRDAIASGKLDLANQHIGELAQLNASYPDVPELRGQLAKARSNAQADQTAALTQGVERGEAELHAGHFSGDDGAAEAIFQDVLKRDPANARAKAGLRAVTQALLVQANAALDDNHVDVADKLLSHAEKRGNGGAELQAARNHLRETREQLDIENQRVNISPEQQNRIRQLLLQANRALAMGNLIVPPGDSAYDKFRAVLAIDGNNAPALDGLKRLPQRAREFFERELHNNQLGRARIQLDALADSDPDAVGLSAMRRRLANAYLDQAEQRMADGVPIDAFRALKNAREIDPQNPRIADVDQKLR